MSSQKLVRCRVRREGSEEGGSTRYVPMELFGLWEHLMQQKHGFNVVEKQASLWIDIEESPEFTYAQQECESVTELTLFVFSKQDQMYGRICRYIPEEEYERVKGILLEHYAVDESAQRSQIKQRRGIWLWRNDPEASVE
jgi:hypothetical protein